MANLVDDEASQLAVTGAWLGVTNAFNRFVANAPPAILPVTLFDEIPIVQSGRTHSITVRQILDQGIIVVAFPTPIPVSGSGPLPPGSFGDVNIRNTSGGPITITLPLMPALGQTLRFKDCAGNAGTYNITITAPPGTAIDGYPTYVLTSNYMSLEVYWTGDMWGTR